MDKASTETFAFLRYPAKRISAIKYHISKLRKIYEKKSVNYNTIKTYYGQENSSNERSPKIFTIYIYMYTHIEFSGSRYIKDALFWV